MSNELCEDRRRIYIELTNRCNFKCSFCPYPSLKKFRPDMQIDLVKKTLEDISKIPYRIVYFHNIGEPLLYPDIAEVLSYCDDLGIRYGLTTNGSLLSKYVDIIKDRHMAQLNISYQSTRKELHAERFTGVSLEQYRKTIMESIKKLKNFGFKGEIRIKILTTGKDSFFKNKKFSNIESVGELIKEISEFYNLLTGQEITELQKSKLSEVDISKHIKVQLISGIFVETFPFLSWGNYEQKVFPAFFGRCNGVKEQLLITSDGKVSPCCYDVRSELVIGNVSEGCLGQVLSSIRARNFAASCSSIYNKYPRCRECQGSRKLFAGALSQGASLFGINEEYQDKVINL